MMTNAVAREEARAGPSGFKRKRRRTCHKDQDKGEENEGSISLTLTKPKLLHCTVCHQPLSIPVFQCENGHLACSPCSSKLVNKCSLCPWHSTLVNDYCKAIEKVLESVKLSCQNRKFGCRVALSYNEKSEHENNCSYIQCSCPFLYCKFTSSSKKLYFHVSYEHWRSATLFWYNIPFSISITSNGQVLLLEEVTERSLFIVNISAQMVNSSAQVIGNVVTITCLEPRSAEERFICDLGAKSMGNTIVISSVMEGTIASRVKNPHPLGSPLVTCGCFDTFGQLELRLCIRPAEQLFT